MFSQAASVHNKDNGDYIIVLHHILNVWIIFFSSEADYQIVDPSAFFSFHSIYLELCGWENSIVNEAGERGREREGWWGGKVVWIKKKSNAFQKQNKTNGKRTSLSLNWFSMINILPLWLNSQLFSFFAFPANTHHTNIHICSIFFRLSQRQAPPSHPQFSLLPQSFIQFCSVLLLEIHKNTHTPTIV